MLIRAELVFNILVLPLLSIFLAYRFGHNGYEAFIATSLGVLILMTIQIIRSIRMLITGHHWLISKLLFCCAALFVWILGFVCEMLLLTASGHDPRVSIPEVNWTIAVVLALGYGLGKLRHFRSATYGRSVVAVFASLYSIIILYIAALSFYSDKNNAQSVILVLAGQLQYILLYIVLRTKYIEWAIAFGQARLGSYNPFSRQPERSGFYIALAALPFFMPVGIIIALTLR